jgi:hypothetical protein
MSAVVLALLLQAGAPAAPPSPAYRGNLTMAIEFQPPATAAATAANGDLLVTSRATYRAKLSTRTDRATRTRQCVVRRGFGLPPIDVGLCGSLLACMATNATRATVKSCMMTRLVADLSRLYGVSAP